jgi:hypothetical protein
VNGIELEWDDYPRELTNYATREQDLAHLLCINLAFIFTSCVLGDDSFLAPLQLTSQNKKMRWGSAGKGWINSAATSPLPSTA